MRRGSERKRKSETKRRRREKNELCINLIRRIRKNEVYDREEGRERERGKRKPYRPHMKKRCGPI